MTEWCLRHKISFDEKYYQFGCPECIMECKNN